MSWLTFTAMSEEVPVEAHQPEAVVHHHHVPVDAVRPGEHDAAGVRGLDGLCLLTPGRSRGATGYRRCGRPSGRSRLGEVGEDLGVGLLAEGALSRGLRRALAGPDLAGSSPRIPCAVAVDAEEGLEEHVRSRRARRLRRELRHLPAQERLGEVDGVLGEAHRQEGHRHPDHALVAGLVDRHDGRRHRGRVEGDHEQRHLDGRVLGQPRHAGEELVADPAPERAAPSGR